MNGKNRQKFWESSDDENWKGNYRSQTESGKNDETGKEVKIRFPVFKIKEEFEKVMILIRISKLQIDNFQLKHFSTKVLLRMQLK